MNVLNNRSRTAFLPELLMAAVAVSAWSIPMGPAVAAPRAGKVVEAPVTDEATLRLARSFRAAGDARSAVPMMKALAARKPADAGLQVELGDTLLEADLIDEAIGTYGAVDAKSPARGEAELGLARAELQLNAPARALAHLDRAQALDPKNARVLVARGVVLDRLSRHADAQLSYRAALAQSPRSVAARTDLALSLAMTGGFDEALEILEPIARSANATPQDRQNLAFVYGLKGDRAGALALSRVDLDEAQAQGNARFFDNARQTSK